MPSVIARRLRASMTDAERRLWARLRRKQVAGHRFRRQVPIGRYVADFACLSANLIVEVDGAQHDIDDVKEIARTDWLEGRGYRVLRYGNRDVLIETNRVVEDIWRQLGSRLDTPHPDPPPQGGRGNLSCRVRRVYRGRNNPSTRSASI
jgi:very-short-patch-repair endonuclease